jgi:hypothetical protein
MPEVTPIASLRPTQMTLGLFEVNKRKAHIAKLTGQTLNDYLDARFVTAVLAPNGQRYIIDRHHLCRALLELGTSDVKCDTVCDASQLAEDEFWRFLDLRAWVQPFDADGKRQPISALPRRIDELVDDPYRSLARLLREEKGFQKDDTAMEELMWADFLRRRINRTLVEREMTAAALQKAVVLAHSKAAAHLPGYTAGIGATDKAA